MKPRKIDERLKRVAESMEDLPIEGTTRIAWSCLTEREKLLYDKTDLIAQKPFYRSQLSDSELLARADACMHKGGEKLGRSGNRKRWV